MVIAPRVKPWRQIDALRAYSDTDARRIYRESWRRNATGLIASLAVGLFVAVAIATVVMTISWSVSRSIYLMLTDNSDQFWQFEMIVPFLIGPLLGVLFFSSFRRQCVEEIVEGELTPERDDISRCMSCGYCLDGLPEIEGKLKCPECACEVSTVWRSILDDLGIERIDKDAAVDIPSGDIARVHRTGSTSIRALKEPGDADAEES